MRTRFRVDNRGNPLEFEVRIRTKLRARCCHHCKRILKRGYHKFASNVSRLFTLENESCAGQSFSVTEYEAVRHMVIDPSGLHICNVSPCHP